MPCIITVVFTLLGVAACPRPYFGEVAPPLALIAVYYWAIHRPDLFRPSMAFLIGLLNDVLHFLPIGLSAMLFVGAHQLVFSQRRFFAGHSFFMMWWGFALTILIWLLGSEWALAEPVPLADGSADAGCPARRTRHRHLPAALLAADPPAARGLEHKLTCAATANADAFSPAARF